VVDQNAIARIQSAVVFAVYRKLFAPDPHVGVTARHVMVSRGVDLLRAWSAGAVAICDDNSVGSDRRLDPAKQEIILPAASGKEERGGAKQDSDGHSYYHKPLFNAEYMQASL
jgi:hypothetical protein